MLQLLVVLAVLMIAGGAYAVYAGAAYVVLESGLALVVGGSVVASAGVLLLGVCGLIREVRTLRAAQTTIIAQASLLNGATRDHDDEPARTVAAPAAAAAAAAGATVAAGTAAAFERLLPPEDAEEPRGRPETEPGAERDAGQLDLALAPAAEPEVEPVAAAATIEPEPPGPDIVEPSSEPEPEALPGQPADAADDADVPPPDDVPTVIGSYASGDFTYVMSSDGSIEAESPGGSYRFASLDELKAFIARGEQEPAQPAG